MKLGCFSKINTLELSCDVCTTDLWLLKCSGTHTILSLKNVSPTALPAMECKCSQYTSLSDCFKMKYDYHEHACGTVISVDSCVITESTLCPNVNRTAATFITLMISWIWGSVILASVSVQKYVQNFTNCSLTRELNTTLSVCFSCMPFGLAAILLYNSLLGHQFNWDFARAYHLLCLISQLLVLQATWLAAMA